MGLGALGSRIAIAREPRFLIVWSVGTLTSITRWLEMLAVGVFVFDLTGSPFITAAMLILRMLPLGLLGVFAGVVAERADRRAIMLIGLFAMAVLSTVLGALAATGTIELWHVALGAFLNGIFWVGDQPVRRTLIMEIAGLDRVGPAIALDTLSNNGTRMLGPIFGGLLLEVAGLDGAYFLGAVLYGMSFIAMALLHHEERREVGAVTGVLRSIGDGFQRMRADRTLVGLLAVTVVFNVFGFPFVSMIPVIGKESLGLSAFPVGVLASMEGAGAFVGGVLVALFSPLAHYRRIYYFGTFLYLAMMLGFAASRSVELSGALLFLNGIGGAAFSAMQATLVLMNSAPHERARMMGLLSVCIGTGPIGFAHLGLLASWLGAPAGIAIIAVEGMIALAFAGWFWPQVVSNQPAAGTEQR